MQTRLFLSVTQLFRPDESPSLSPHLSPSLRLSLVHSKQRPAAAVRGSVPSGSPKRVAPFRPQQEQQENLQREKKEAQRREREREVQERENEKEAQKAEVSSVVGLIPALSVRLQYILAVSVFYSILFYST